MADVELPYTSQEHDRWVKVEHIVDNMSGTVKDMSVLKDNILKLTFIQESMLKDNQKRDLQWLETMKENEKQWKRISDIAAKFDENVARIDSSLQTLNEKNKSTEKQILKISDNCTKAEEQEKTRQAELKKSRSVSKWSLITAVGVALVTVIGSIILALINANLGD